MKKISILFLFVCLYDKDFYVNGQSNNETSIERPCKVYDKNCIRRFFAAHADCKPMYQAVPDPLFRPQSSGAYMSRVNLTISAVDVYYSGVNARIDEFYINKKTDRLLLAFTYYNFTISSQNFYFRFYRPAQEPIVTTASGSIIYASLTATVIIPNLKNLRLDKSEIFIYSDMFAPISLIDFTTLIQSADPTVQRSLLEFFAGQEVDQQEGFLTDGNYFAASFIQQSICDFGLIQS